MMPYALVLVFALFQAFGGVAFGSGLRLLYAALRASDAAARSASLKQARSALTAGLAFGGVLTVVEVAYLLPINRWLVLAGPAVLLLTLLGSAFLPATYLQEIGAGTFAGIGIGVIVVPLGVLVAMEGFRNGDPVFGLLWGGCAGFVGLVFLLGGLQALLSGKSLVLHQSAPGSFELMSPEAAVAADAATDQPDPSAPDPGGPSTPATTKRPRHHNS